MLTSPGSLARPVCRPRRTSPRPPTAALRLRVIDEFDASFTLDPAAEAQLVALLATPSFAAQVAANAGWPLEGTPARFTGRLFQPAPYTKAAPLGVPPDLEPQARDPAFALINVPYNFMFACKIAHPPRLCAVFARVLPE